MPDQKTPKAKAEELLEGLLRGKEVHQIFAENMRKQLTISGKGVDFWEDKFKITIPTDNLTPALCKELAMKLMELNQEAVFYHAVAQAKSQFLRRGSEATFNNKFWTIVQEHKQKGGKIPAAATLERLAKCDNEEYDSAQTIADVEMKFWKDILDHLSTCRKLIENASLNVSVELKSFGQGQSYSSGGHSGG